MSSSRRPTRTAVLALILAGACSKASVINVGEPTGGTTVGATGGAGGQGSPGSGGNTVITLEPTTTITPPDPDASVTSQVVGCDGGDACVCPTLSVAVVGNRGVWGDGSDTAFKDWLNSNSSGTAKVRDYPTKPEFTADFLAGYNLIILAGLGDDSNNGPWWAFSDQEVATFEDWIVNKGGGVISLSGYSNDNNEIVAKNALLAFSGISYKQECISPPCALVDSSGNKMCYRCGNPYQITDWVRDDSVIANLSLGVTLIGIDGARPINAPADAHVAATTTNATSVSNWMVGKVTGKGRVLVYADEWITYTDQWSGKPTNSSNDPSCTGLLPQDKYQTAQLWYNMIHWTQPSANCFTIVSTQTPIKIW